MKVLSAALLLASLSASAVFAVDLNVQLYKPSPPAKALDAALESASGQAALRDIAKDYQKRCPTDMAVQLRVAGILAVDNLDSTRNFYKAWAVREPQNPVPLYLAGRFMQSYAEQRDFANRILALDADNYWGNLLLASSYPLTADSTFELARAALLKSISADNSLPFAVERLGNVLLAHGDRQQADQVFAKLCQMQPDRFEPLLYRLKLVSNDFNRAVAMIDEFLDRNPTNASALYAKGGAQREQSDWSGYIATMRRLVAVSVTADHAYDMGCAFSLNSQPDSAFAWLEKAADLGNSDIDQYKNDDDLVPLRDDPRWNELLLRVQASVQKKMAEYVQQAAQQRSSDRRAEPGTPAAAAAAPRQDAPAPDFTLEDLNGKQVSLSSLRGKVVVLDFWATWCGPCKRTMPVLDAFYTGKKSKDIVVYGVNVWERAGRDKIKPFLEERQIHFPVLFGNDETANAYGVRGIPTMVVIDKKGRIAYRHVGFNPSLGDMLTNQTNELLK